MRRGGAGRTASSGDACATPTSAPARTRCRSERRGAGWSIVTSTGARSASTTTTFSSSITAASIRPVSDSAQPVESLAICFSPRLVEQIHFEGQQQPVPRASASARRGGQPGAALHPPGACARLRGRSVVRRAADHPAGAHACSSGAAARSSRPLGADPRCHASRGLSTRRARDRSPAQQLRERSRPDCARADREHVEVSLPAARSSSSTA